MYETGTHDSKPQKKTVSSQPHLVSVGKTVDKEADVGISDSQSTQIPTGHDDSQQLSQTEKIISHKNSGLTMDIKHTSSNVSNNSSASSGIQSEEALISPTEEYDNPIDKSTIMPDLPQEDLFDRLLLQRPKITKSLSVEQSIQPVVMGVPKTESSIKDSGYSTRHTKLAQSTIFQQVGNIHACNVHCIGIV